MPDNPPLLPLGPLTPYGTMVMWDPAFEGRKGFPAAGVYVDSSYKGPDGGGGGNSRGNYDAGIIPIGSSLISYAPMDRYLVVPEDDIRLVKVRASMSFSEDFDPNGLGQHEPGAKLDAGKPYAGLIQNFGPALMAVAEVATYGANKYTRDGWEHVKDGPRRYHDAAWRHLLQAGHEKNDRESGLPHEFHALWNLLASLTLRLREQSNVTAQEHTTDRIPPEPVHHSSGSGHTGTENGGSM